MGARLWVPVPSGPLARYASGYGLWLIERGYSRWTVAHRLWQLDLLSRWLERERLSPGELAPGRVEEFLAERCAAGAIRRERERCHATGPIGICVSALIPPKDVS